MPEEILQNEPVPPPIKKKMATGTKVAIGCGSGCLLVVVLFVVGAIVSAFYVKKMVTRYEEELKGYGFEKVTSGQMLDMVNPVTEPVLLKGQMVRIMAGSTTNLAVLAQACEVSGRIEGTLYFRGQVLTVNPGAVIAGGVDAHAQALINNGSIEGGITGKYQALQPPQQ